ncbi:MAG: hybrid sensor histidine kinase/response regulator [Bacteroidota bacterium]
MTVRYFLFLFLILLCPRFLQAQNDTLLFKQLSIQEGLSQGVFPDILQDSEGFMWFATFSGLNRYDGNEVVIYKADGQPGSLKSQEISSLFEDSQQRLWIGTLNHLYLYQKTQNSFLQIQTSWEPDENVKIQDIFEDRSGVLWVATNQGVAILNSTTKRLVRTGFSFSPTEGEAPISAYSIEQCDNGDIWFATNSGILQYDKDLEKARWHLAGTYATQIAFSNHGVLVASTNDGLYRWNPQDGLFDHVFSLYAINIKDRYVRDLVWGPHNHLWIATTQGVVVLDEYFRLTEHIQAQVNNPRSLISNVVQRIYFDHSQRLWVGSMGGVSVEYEEQKAFYNNSLSTKKNSLKEAPIPVWSIFESPSSGELYIGTLGNGLFLVSPEHPDKIIANFTKTHLPFLTIYDIHQLDEQRLLLAGSKGLALFDLHTQTAHPLSLGTEEMSNRAVYHLARLRDGVYFLATSSGVFLYNHHQKKLLSLDDYLKKPLINKAIVTLEYTSAGYLWVGTKEGLKRIRVPKDYAFLAGDKLDIREVSLNLPQSGPLVVTAIREQPSKALWVATTEGLFELSSNGTLLRSYTGSMGLPSDFINSLQMDYCGNLWVSTNKGLSVLYKQHEQWIHFDALDGLQNLEFNNESSCVGSNGHLYFGGINGITYFVPDSIQTDFTPPRVKITGIRLSNQKVKPNERYNGQVVLEKPILEVDTLELHHKNSFLSFQFTSFSFGFPEQARYAYRMKGLETNWNHVKGKSVANYLSLPPGEYLFQVKAANRDNMWNKEGDEMLIIIHPPFWQRTWVVFLGVVGLLALFFMYVKLRSRKLQRRKAELEHEVKQRTAEFVEAHEELNQSIAFNKNIVANAREGITVVSSKGEIRFVNRAACRLLLYSSEELLTKRVPDLTPIQYHEHDRVMMDVLLKQGTASYEKKLIRKDGTLIDVQINASYNAGAEDDSVISIFSDITERKSNLQELERYRNQLEQIVDERTRELIVQKEKAERADRLKSAFLANMSHEVRTPLNAIVGFSSLLKRHQDDSLENHEYIGFIEQSSQSLLQLIQDIIDLSKLETGEIQLIKSDFNLNMLVAHALTNLEAKRKTEQKNVVIHSFNHPDNIWVHSDEKRIRQVLEALLDNALKYTDEGTIHVELAPASENSHVRVLVKDTGIGIPEACKEEIFERFVKLESPEKRIFRGTGLGLSIVKHISQLLNLDITVKSIAGQGSVFSFTLPVADHKPSRIETVKAKAEFAPNLEGHNIMIAEDDEPNFLLLNEYLKRTKAKVEWARNGVEVMQKMKSVHPDLIFMDLKMPEKDGLEATRMLRSGGVTTPIIALTAYTQEHDKVAALKAGCNDYLKKPASLRAVYDLLRKYLGEKR